MDEEVETTRHVEEAASKSAESAAGREIELADGLNDEPSESGAQTTDPAALTAAQLLVVSADTAAAQDDVEEVNDDYQVGRPKVPNIFNSPYQCNCSR